MRCAIKGGPTRYAAGEIAQSPSVGRSALRDGLPLFGYSELI